MSRSRMGVGLAWFLLTVSVAVFATSAQESPNRTAPRGADGLAAWQQIHSVLIHPRCINCHTAVDYPQQGDERRRHYANVVRGPDGQGVPGLQCATCHQESNANSTGVPGSHDWHLAPLSMAWQDRNDKPLWSAAICRAITDRRTNHNMDGPALLKHNAEDTLVGWAWEPGRDIHGNARTVPPLSRAEFAEATRQWVEAGMPCPQM